MYRKVMLSLTLLCLILLTLIAWKVDVFTTTARLPFFRWERRLLQILISLVWFAASFPLLLFINGRCGIARES